MRRWILHSFIFLFFASSCLPGDQLCELLKLPRLFAHYEEHKREVGSTEMTFTDFLFLHYGQSNGHASEQDHHDLPLLHHCCTNSVYISDAGLQPCRLEPVAVVYPARSGDGYDHQAQRSIFQPPRFS
jgi:hypothetical protein